MSQSEVENFDRVHPERADREFILAGERFHWRKVHWREYGEMADKLISQDEEEPSEEEPGGKKDLTVIEMYEQLVERLVVYIEKDEVTRFRTTVEDPEKEITQLQLTELRDWLNEKQTSRPTQQPSPSDVGRGGTAPISRAA